ncbi:MAG: phosphatidylglycerol lysyltransferase domain-containing protein, partial [Planctomycetota bacterium]
MTEIADNTRVPGFPDFEPLETTHRDIVNVAAGEAQPRASEMTFAYLFAWRDYIRPRISRYGDSLLVLVYSSRDDASYLLPPLGGGHRVEVLRAALDEAHERGITDSAARLPEELADEFVETDDYEAYPERHRADYVYRQSDLRDLPLPDYRDKRNRANRFWSSYSGVEYHPLDEDRAAQCIRFCRQWRENHPKGDEPGLVR